MANELGSVSVSVKVETSQLEAGLSKARAETEKFDKAATKASQKGVKTLGKESKKSTKEVSKLQGSLKRAGESAAFVTGPLGGVASRIGLIGSAASAGALPILALSVALAGLTVGLKKALDQAEIMERGMFKLQGVLRATGNASGLTANEIRAFARETAAATLASTEGVERAAAALLTFKEVQGEVFKEALRLAQDLAAGGFGTLESNAKGFGKALQDPITGMMLLNRQGSLTKAQQKQIGDEFKKTGDLAKAQGSILAALRGQVGGLGSAEGAGLSGAYDLLSQRVAEFLENIGNNGPIQATTRFINAMALSVDNLNKTFFKSDQSKINELLGERNRLLEKANTIPLFGALPGVQTRIDRLNAEITAIQDRGIAEQKAKKIAVEGAAAASAQADADRKNAAAQDISDKAREKSISAAEALAEQRRQTIGGLRDEVSVLGQLSNLYIGTSMSAEQLAVTGDVLRTQSMLRTAANSDEGQSLAALIAERATLQASIDAETEKRQALASAQADFDARIEGVRDQIAAIKTETAALGMATRASEEYRIEQELINAAVKEFGTLSQDQIDQIRKVAAEYGEVADALQKVKDAQEAAKKDAEEWSDSIGGIVTHLAENIQDTLADFLFDPFADGTKSMGEQFSIMLRKMAAEVAAAEIMKGLLGGLESLGGVGEGAGGGGGSGGAGFFGSLLSVGASLFHEGGTVGQDGKAISVPAATFIGAPRFHQGLKPDEFPAILQQGEEVVPKDKVGSRGGVTNINNWNITTPDPNAFRESQRQINRKIAVRAQTR